MAEKGSYQVFINHRGLDTKKTLAVLIHRDLKAEGVSVFLDEKEIQTGDRNEDEIKEAIASSYVYIAIFSPRYAESRWCLDELCWMQEQPKRIFIPIFYNVKPSDVRHILGTYAEAFTRHRENHRFEDQELDKWKIALRKVPDTKGEEFNPEDPSETRDIVKVVDKVVNMVLEEVWIKEPQEVAEHAVGLEQAAEEFENEISKQYKGNGIITVGIWGEGGSGKSTFVKYLYNMKRAQFEKSYLLSVAREKDRPSSPSLQHRLQRHPHLPIEDRSDGTGLLQQLKEHLEGYPKVLIIFDELFDSKQIKSLLSLKGKLGDGSMMVVTSRDRNLLTRSQADIFYVTKPLDDANARYLFSQLAVYTYIPPSGLQDVLGICEGLPLALKVLAEQHFCGVTDQSSWEKERKRLDRELPDDIKKILNTSYMSLGDVEKEVFLDAAHFFMGEDRDLVKRVLEGLDNNASSDSLDRLEQKCLVGFENPQSKDVCTDQSRSPKNCLKMKRLVRDLARIKAREEFESKPKITPLRLSWTDNRRISENDFPFQSNVRGIRISSWSRKSVRKEIKGLKFLVLENSAVPFCPWSGDLVWLRLHNVDLNDVFPGPSLVYLRVMELKDVKHLQNLSNQVHYEPPLKRRTLPGSSRSIQNLPMPSLVHLDLSGLSNLKESPDFTSLLYLQYLALKDCSNLTTIELGGISTIICLDVEGCGELKYLNVQGLKSIKEINVAGCWKLQSIKGFGQLEALSYFNISTASKLNNILPFPSNISTAILSVAASPMALDLVKERMVETPQDVTFYDLSATASQTSLRDTSSNSIIVVCFIGERRSDFQVRFGCDDGQIKTFDAKGSHETMGSELSTGTPMMRIFMWTEDSEELKDLKFRGREVISCTVQADNALRGPEKGVIMMCRNKCDGVKLLKLLC